MIAIDGALVVADGQVRTGTVLVANRKIAALAWTDPDRAALRTQAADIVDGNGHYLMPGLIDGHAHAYGSLLRGTENSLPLELWALHTTLHGRATDGPALHSAIMLGAAERIRAGITGAVDHAPNFALAQTSLAAHEASGLRAAFAPFLHDLSDYDLMDLPIAPDLYALVGGPPPVDADRYTSDFAALVQQARAGSGRVEIQLGPNAPQRCSPASWALWRALRDRHDVAVHTHLLETRAQRSLNRLYPGGLVAAMARNGMLEGRLTCAHGVWLAQAEMEILARHNVTVSHNPASNLMLGSGVLNFCACQSCGLRLAIGNDSTNTGGRTDIFANMRLAMMLPRRAEPDFAQWPKADAVFAAATEGGAAALGLAGKLGRIAPGQLADLVLVQANHAATLAAPPSLDVLVQHAGPEHVRSVMVDGAWVMRDGVIIAFDEAEMLHGAAIQAKLLRDRVADQLPVLMAAFPAMSAQFARDSNSNP